MRDQFGSSSLSEDDLGNLVQDDPYHMTDLIHASSFCPTFDPLRPYHAQHGNTCRKLLGRSRNWVCPPSSDSDLGLISALSIGSHQSLPAFRSGTAKAPVLARPMEDMEAGGFQPGL